MALPTELALALLDELPEGVAVVDAGQDAWPVIHANRTLATLRGDAPEAHGPGDFATLVRDAEEYSDATALQAALRRGEAVTFRARTGAPAGTPAVLDVRLVPVRGPDGGLTHVFAFHRIPPGMEVAPPEARPLLREDRLTGLCHAEWFRELYKRDFAIASREGRLLTLFLVDIDALGSYNDTFGVQAGDSVVRRVGRTLLSALRRGSDLVARLEGGRFVGFSTGMTHEQAMRHAETLAARVRELHVHHPRSRVARFVTVSVGVATGVPAPGMRPDTLFDAAQQALEGARGEGRNRVVGTSLPKG
jgi:diguanylate cyclase (GGDEF)-like protein